MVSATRIAISAAGYFLGPLALYIGLIALGTFTGYLLTTNAVISALLLCGLFVGAFLSLFRQYRINALMLICSVLLIGVYIWHFGEDPIRRYLYVAEVLMTPHFEQKCVPADGIPLTDRDTLRLCSTHDFNLGGWIDSIVKINGSYAKERLIDDINSGKLKPRVVNRFNEVFAATGTGRHLWSDYYLIQDRMR